MLQHELKDVSGRLLESWFRVLTTMQEGCGAIWYATSRDCETRFFVVVGFPPKELVPKGRNRNEVLAWKIGIQSVNNGMQTDFNIDFDVPKNHVSGEVEDTTEPIYLASHTGSGNGVPAGYRSWNDLAQRIRTEARRVYKIWG